MARWRADVCDEYVGENISGYTSEEISPSWRTGFWAAGGDAAIRLPPAALGKSSNGELPDPVRRGQARMVISGRRMFWREGGQPSYL